jgi:hypothetical protein
VHATLHAECGGQVSCSPWHEAIPPQSTVHRMSIGQLTLRPLQAAGVPQLMRQRSPRQPPVHAAGHIPEVEVPAEHVPTGHTLHAPELARSQPFEATPSQSENELRQASLQTPTAQTAVALGPGGHTRPHAPQFSASCAVLISQPSAGLALQSE